MRGPPQRPQAARLRPRACAGSASLRSAVSTTTRSTATGRPRRRFGEPGGLHVDRASLPRRAARAARRGRGSSRPCSSGSRRGAEPASAAAARRGACCPDTGSVVAVLGRSSVASTTSPGRSDGSTAPQRPAIADRVARPRSRPRARPMPERRTLIPGSPERTASASIRSGASTTSFIASSAAERRHREDEPVQVVVDVEVAREAGAGVLRLVPAAVRAAASRRASAGRARPRRSRSPAACSASSAQAVCDAVDSPRPLQRRVVVGAQVLAPAAVGVLHLRSSQRDGARGSTRARAGCPRRPAPGRRRRCRRRGCAPAAEPGAVGLLLAQQPVDPALRGRVARAAPRPAEHLDHVRGDVGARRVDHLAEVAERELRGSARWCCRRRTRPSRRRATRIPSVHATPRGDRFVQAGQSRRALQGQDHLGGVVDVGVAVVLELERPAARRQVEAGGPPSRRGARISSLEQPAARRARSPGGRVRARRRRGAISASAVSQTGDWQASSRRIAVLDDREPVEALEALAGSPGGRADSRAGAAR